MYDKFFVGGDVMSFSDNGELKPVSRVTLMLDDSNSITAGDDTGREIVANCPHATQKMVNDLLRKFRGSTYRAYEAIESNIDPSAELGDGATVCGVYGAIARMSDNGSGYSTISAPGKEDLEDEFPLEGPISRMIGQQIKKVGSSITKTAEEIRAEVRKLEEGISGSLEKYSTITQTADAIKAVVGELDTDDKGDAYTVKSYIEQTADAINTKVSGLEGNYSTISQTVSGISTKVSGLEGNYSTISQTVSGISTKVSGLEGNYSTISQTVSGIKADVAGYLGMDDAGNPIPVSSSIKAALEGITLEASSSGGKSTFTIKSGGVQIATKEIDLTVDAANISGNVNLGGLLTVYDELGSNVPGGYLGYDDGFNSTTGIGIRSYWNGLGPQMVCTEQAARLSYSMRSGVYLYQNGVTCQQGSLVLDAASLIQWRFGIPLAVKYNMDADSFYPASTTVTLGTANYKWKDVYAAGTSFSALVARVAALEGK